MSSGEDIPEGHSLRARIMIIQVEERDIDPDQLRRLQAAGSSGLLAQAMAGDLTVKSSPGKGARFTLELPGL